MSAFRRRYMIVASAVALSIGRSAASAQGPSFSCDQAQAGSIEAVVCDGNPANEVVVTFFQTAPPVLIAERGDRISMMYVQPSASGAKYQSLATGQDHCHLRIRLGDIFHAASVDRPRGPADLPGPPGRPRTCAGMQA